ncbi:MAG: GNAT family N-acetyltransferase [Treponema sp.]|nr:GNAT family N-acetyltransferase [Treponema sp.]
MRVYTLSELSNNSILQVENFVKAHELTSTTLASHLRKKSENLIVISDEAKSDNKKSEHVQKIIGLMNIDSSIYHCLPRADLLSVEEFISILKLFMKKPVRCISGQAKATDFLVKVLAQIDMSNYDSDLPKNSFLQPKQSYYYKMMEFPEKKYPDINNPNKGPLLSNGDEIIRCTENDIELLHPLQKAYMKEEVAVSGRQISDAEVSITLRQILKNQICLTLMSDGEAVAKANTNAIGFNCIQIGGVFTNPLYRRNGYAAALVSAICRRAINANKQPVLFVKEKNMPAFTLYQKLGFVECGQYEIVYY